MKCYMLGLTGGIACGKSTIARKLEDLGAAHLDADAISHSLTAPYGEALPRIREEFGDEVFFENGELNRRALGSVIFTNEEKKHVLEGIIHPMVQSKMLRMADEAAAKDIKVCVLNVPLLYEIAMDVLCDSVWVAALPKESQIVRVMMRDSITREEAIARIDNQMPTEEKIRRAQYVFYTDKPEVDTLKEVERRYKELLRTL